MSNDARFSGVSDACLVALRALTEDEEVARALRAAPTPTLRRYRDRFTPADFHALVSLGRNALCVLDVAPKDPPENRANTSTSVDDDTKVHVIRGRVERSGTVPTALAGLTIELWETNASSTTPRASVVTDGVGRFEAVVHARDLATPSGELYFRIQSGGVYWKDPSATWRPHDKARPVVLVVSGTHVEGHLRNQDGTPVSGYIVKAFSSTMRTEDLLGQATTDSNGFYSVDFTFGTSPKLDLMVRAYTVAFVEVAHASLTTNASQNVTIDLVVGNTTLAGVSEYGAISAAIDASRGIVLAKDLTSADVTAIANKYGLAAGLIQLAVDANAAANAFGSPPTTPELFYAIGHSRQRVNVASAMAMSHDARLGAVNHAIEAGYVSSLFAATATAQLAALEGNDATGPNNLQTLLVLNTGATSSRLAMMLAIAGITNSSSPTNAAVISAYLKYAGALETFWTTPNTGLSSGQLTAVQNALSLGIYVLNHPPMVASLWNAAIQTPQALALQTEAQLVTRIGTSVAVPLPGGGSSPSAVIGVPPEVPSALAADYAHAIATAVSQAFPSSAFVGAYNVSPIAGTTGIATFLAAPVNAGFDFAATTVRAWVRANPTAFSGNAAAQPLVEKMARLFKISPEVSRYAAVSTLWNAGFDSARSIFLYSREAFLAKMTSVGWTQALALQVYSKAAHTSGLAAAIAMQYGGSFQAPGSSGVIPQPGLNNGVVAPPVSIPDWQSMFGNLDYCQCDECASVLGAAAYLTDLLHFAEQRPSTTNPKMLDTLRSRRPDISRTQLSCKNTNTILPSIDITNEVLERRTHPTAVWPAAISPDAISGLSGWWRADNMSVDGSAHVTTATDLSGQGNTLTASPSSTLTLALQAGANNQMGLVCNASGALVGKTIFQGVSDQACTFVCIAQTSLTTGPKYFWENGGLSGAAAGYGYAVTTTSVRSEVDGGSSPADTEALTTSFEVTAWIGHATGATAGNRELWVNGVQHALTTSNTTLPTPTTLGFFLGGWANSNSNALTGVIYEMIVFNRALTAVELKGLAAYANQRYGSAIPLTTWAPAYQTTWTQDQLAVHPEHLLTGAYDDLQGKIYPWAMPYSLYLDEGRSYIGLHSVTRAEIRAASLPLPQSVNDPYSDADWAKEILGMTELQRQVIQGSGSLIASYQAWNYWGIESPPTCWYGSLASVPVLLTKSGLAFADASAVVATGYVTAAQTAVVTVDLHGGCDTSAATLDNLDLSGTTSAGFFDRMHRFGRLWDALGWTIRQTDRAIVNLGAGTLDTNLIAPLAYAKEITRRTSATLDAVLTWRANTMIDTAPDASGLSPFERLFPSKGASIGQNPFALNVARTALNDESKLLSGYLSTIAAALGTDLPSIQAVVTYESLGSANLTLKNISTLYRYVTLASAVSLPVTSLLVLLAIAGRTPFSASTPSDAIRLLDEAADATSYGLTPEQIRYLIWHADVTAPKSTTVTCTVTTAAGFLGAAAATLDTNGNVTANGGLLASIAGSSPAMVFTNVTAVASGAGTPTVTFVCTQSGPVACATGTLTVEANTTPVTGWTSINNTQNGVPGADGTQTIAAAVIRTFLESLRDALAAVAKTPAAIDVSGVVTQTYLNKFYANTATPSDATTAYAIVAGTSGMTEAAQNSWIDAHGWSQFVNTATAKASLTSPTTGFVGNDARFGYFQPFIQIFIDKQSLAVDRVASAFGVKSSIADRIVRTYVHARTASGTADTTTALSLISSLDANSGATATISSVTSGVATLTGLAHMTPNSVGRVLDISGAATAANNGAFVIASYISATSVTITNPGAVAADANNGAIGWLEHLTGPLTVSTAPAAWYTYLHLQKVCTLAVTLKLTDADAVWVFGANCPVVMDSMSVVPITTTTLFPLFARLIHAAKARNDFAGAALFDIFTNQASYASVNAVLADVANRTGWNVLDLQAFQAGFTPTIAQGDFIDERPIVRLKNGIGIVQRLNIPGATVYPNWANVAYGAAAGGAEALAIKEAVRGSFPADQWADTVTPTRNALRERQRDAMVSYLVGQPGYLPTQIPGLIGWFRSDMGVTLDGSGNVVSWTDQSGRGNVFSQSTIANRPRYSATGIPYLYAHGAGGSGDNTRLTGTIPGISGAQTYVVVFTTATVSPQGSVMSSGSTESIVDLGTSINWANTDAKTFASGLTVGSTAIVTAAQTDSTTNGANLYFNGALTQTFTPTGVSGSIDSLMGTASGNAMGGHLFEVIVFNRALTASELGNLHAYLADRYGVTLPTSPTTRRYIDADDLSGDVLLDVQQQSCGQTSRIVQANASTQTFLERVLLNLESGYSLSTDDARQWQWMKHYRVWQANREIFLYPENWVEPSLRDNKTPFFKAMETKLAGQPLTDDSVEDALIEYLHSLDEVAHLDVVAMLNDLDTDTNVRTLHVVARTRAHPHVYYYRARVGDGSWAPWSKIDVDIQSDHAFLAMYNRRPFLIWANVTQSSKTSNQLSQQSTPSTPTKLFQIRLRWSSLRHGKWGKVQQSVSWIPSERWPLQPAEARFEVTAATDDPTTSQSGSESMQRAANSLAFRFSIDSNNDLKITVINSNYVNVTPS